MATRLKLFSSEEPKRLKLFSSEPGMVLRELICPDCGQVITTAESPTHAVCPNCGGKRMILKLFPTEKVVEQDLQEKLQEEEKNPEEEVIIRKPLFQDDALSTKLEDLSGKTIDKETFEKTFSESEADIVLEKNYAVCDGEGNYSISDSAYQIEKTFSRLIISVVKTLELDPSIMNGSIKKEDIIDKLEEHEALPEKGINALKKAHGIPVEEKPSAEDTWLEDSSIISDLGLEYNNQSFGIGQFIELIHDRYPDAPKNILDILVKKGVAKIDGTKVIIQKDGEY